MDSLTTKLWRFLLEKEKLTVRLAELAATNEQVVIRTATAGSLAVKVERATVPGDNYMSNAFKVICKQIESGAEYQAFVKTVSTMTMMFQGAMAESLYEREIGVFTVLHPMLRELRDKAKVPAIRLPLRVPEIFFTHLDLANPPEANTTVMAFEDLKQSGYRMVDRRVGASFVEARLVLESLANYHALTIALLRKFANAEGEVEWPENLAFAQKFNAAMLDIGYQVLGLSINTFGKMLLKNNMPEVASWLDKEYKEELQTALRPLTMDQCKPLMCISHGDCWSNNMMFRYDDKGQAIDMALVDWQISRFGHPATDIVHFLYSSTTSETREKHLGELLNHYYDTLTGALDMLHCRVIEENQYSRRRFLKDVQKRLHFALAMSLLMLPPIMEDSYGTMMAEQQSNGHAESNSSKSEVVADSNTLSAEGSDKIPIPDQPFDIEAISQNLPLDKLLMNDPLCKRVVTTVAEIKQRLEQNCIV